MSLVLSIFPGIGLLDMAFEQEGFCVVRGPDLLWGGDIRRFHPPAGKFDGVIGGPPCQMFSRLQHVLEAQRAKGVEYRRAENLIPEFARVVRDTAPAWWLMENVPEAPAPDVHGYLQTRSIVSDVWVGGATSRTRQFVFGTAAGLKLEIEWAALHATQPHPAVLAKGYTSIPVAIGGSGKRKSTMPGFDRLTTPRAAELQGLPADFLAGSPFTAAGRLLVIGNGVPLPMGRAIAKSVKRAVLAGEGAR